MLRICNSWDRREWFFDCALSGSALSGNCLMPKMIRTQHNMFIGTAGWNMDHGAIFGKGAAILVCCSW